MDQERRHEFAWHGGGRSTNWSCSRSAGGGGAAHAACEDRRDRVAARCHPPVERPMGSATASVCSIRNLSSILVWSNFQCLMTQKQKPSAANCSNFSSAPKGESKACWSWWVQSRSKSR